MNANIQCGIELNPGQSVVDSVGRKNSAPAELTTHSNGGLRKHQPTLPIYNEPIPPVPFLHADASRISVGDGREEPAGSAPAAIARPAAPVSCKAGSILNPLFYFRDHLKEVCWVAWDQATHPMNVSSRTVMPVRCASLRPGLPVDPAQRRRKPQPQSRDRLHHADQDEQQRDAAPGSHPHHLTQR